MSNNQDVAQTIKHFITTNFYLSNPAGLTPRASFFEQGIVDSTGVLEVVSFLEETFGITVHDSEMIPENLDSLQGLEAFVERKLSAMSPLRLVPNQEPSSRSPIPHSDSLAPIMLARGENDPR